MELVETFVLSWTELLEACGIPSRRAILINLKKKKNISWLIGILLRISIHRVPGTKLVTIYCSGIASWYPNRLVFRILENTQYNQVQECQLDTYRCINV